MKHVFDTLAFAKRLEAVGFTRQQAEALADEQAKLIDERLATKLDIVEVRADIAHVRADIENAGIQAKRDIEALRLETSKEISRIAADTKFEILKWMFSMVAVQTIAIIGALVGLIHNGAR